MNYQKYKILKFINKCPDPGIPKVVIHNSLNIANNELDNILKLLLEDEFIFILQDKYKSTNPNYSLTLKGIKTIKKYPLSIINNLLNKYFFPILLSLFFFILGLILG